MSSCSDSPDDDENKENNNVQTNVSWTPLKIEINPGNEFSTINIMEAFTNKGKPLLPLSRMASKFAKINKDKPVIVFPPSIFPPIWSERKVIEKAIICAAADHGNTDLIRGRTNPKKFYTILSCKFGRRYYHKKKGYNPKSGEIYNNCKEDDDDEDDDAENGGYLALPEYKQGIREDRFINKNKASRGIKGKSMAKRTNTLKPPLEKKCQFQIMLQLIPGKHWFIAKAPMETGCHNHTRLANYEKNRSRSSLSQEQIDKTVLCMNYCNSGATKNLMRHELNGGNLSRSQIQYSQQVEEENELYGSDMSDDEIQGSSAAQLIAYLKKQVKKKKMRYVAVYHDVTETSLVVIKKATLKAEAEAIAKAKQKRNKQQTGAEVTKPKDNSLDYLEEAVKAYNLQLKITGADPNEEEEEIEKDYELQSSEEKLDLGTMLIPIRKRLVVGKRVLLGCAWCREDERLLFDMFPHVLNFDVTFQTNNEERPLATTACPDGLMKTFSPVKAFLPSQCAWVFEWIFGTVFPTLLPKHALDRTQLVLTDGDDKIYKAFDKFQPLYYPNAKHGLCVYHLVVKGLERAKPNMLGKKDQADVQALESTFKNWVYTWMQLGGVETEEEFQLSHNNLKLWLKEKVTNPKYSKEVKHNASELDAFLINGILKHKSRWFFPTRIGKFCCICMGEKCTSRCEGLHHTMKLKSSKVVTPSMSMLRSLKTQDVQAETRMKDWFVERLREYQSHPLWVKKSPTAKSVNTLCESILHKLRREIPNYAIKMETNFCILVGRLPDKRGAFCEECSVGSPCALCHDKSPITRFKRIRTITIQEVIPGQLFEMKCTCLFQKTTGIPCQHMVCVLNVKPCHIHIRWRKDYAALYKRPGHKHEQLDFLNWRNETRVLLSVSELSNCISYARSISGKYDPKIFEVPHSIPFSKSQFGMLDEDALYKNITREGIDLVLGANKDIYEMGFLSQEIGCPEYDEDSEDEMEMALLSQQEEDEEVVLQSNNAYKNMVSHIEILTSRCKNTPGLMSEMMMSFYEWHSEWAERIDDMTSTEKDGQGKYISCFTATDSRKKCCRIKSSCEPNRKKKKNSKENTRLSFEGSVM